MLPATDPYARRLAAWIVKLRGLDPLQRPEKPPGHDPRVGSKELRQQRAAARDAALAQWEADYLKPWAGRVGPLRRAQYYSASARRRAEHTAKAERAADIAVKAAETRAAILAAETPYPWKLSRVALQGCREDAKRDLDHKQNQKVLLAAKAEAQAKAAVRNETKAARAKVEAGARDYVAVLSAPFFVPAEEAAASAAAAAEPLLLVAAQACDSGRAASEPCL